MTIVLPYISKQLNGMIWRMEIDSKTDTLVLETRTADKQVAFTAIDLVTGETNFENIGTPERWLTGMEGIYNGITLLHNYQGENSPVHKGVIAVDRKGVVIWSNYTYAFDHLSVNGPILYNIQLQPKKLFLVDIDTGAYLRAYQPVVDTEPPSDIIFPEILSSDLLDMTLPVTPHGNIVHSVHHNNFRIVSLHSSPAGRLLQHLFVMDGTDIVYEDLLHEDIQKMQPESFMLCKDRLIYIKNKSELKIVNL